MHNANKTERFISIPSLVVRNCTVTPTAMSAALQSRIRRRLGYAGQRSAKVWCDEILFRIAICQWKRGITSAAARLPSGLCRSDMLGD